MRVLVIGSGAREHAIVRKLLSEGHEVLCAPGNAGIRQDCECFAYNTETVMGLVTFAHGFRPDLTVVGPENLLADGIVDAFQEAGRSIFGPNLRAAEIESSKHFCKTLLSRANIPTARWHSSENFKEARWYLLHEHSLPVVIKANSLAAGKGVRICRNYPQAEVVLDKFMKQRVLGEAGRRVVIEEFLEGREMSFHVITDGTNAVPLLMARDYKTVDDGDQGPMTGGMGGYCPRTDVSPTMYSTIMERIVHPTLYALRAEDISFRGVLYFGLMITDAGPKVLEINARFGDPETQLILPLLETGLDELLLAAVDPLYYDLGKIPLTWRNQCTVGIVLTSPGYPDNSITGYEIVGLDQASTIPGINIFHAGTKQVDGKIVTNGGRVLTVVGMGDGYLEAKLRADQAVAMIGFEGTIKDQPGYAHFRRDIAAEVIQPSPTT